MTSLSDTSDDFFQSIDGASAFEPEQLEPADLSMPPRLGLLAGLGPEEFTVVARSAKLGFFEPDQVVFSQGDHADRFFVLVDGRVRIDRDGEKIAELGPGSFFGESALYVGGRRSASVTAIEPTSLWSVGYDAFNAVVAEHLLGDDSAQVEVESRLAQAPPDSFE